MRREPVRFDYWRVEKPGAAVSFALYGRYVRDYRGQTWRYRVRLDHAGGRVVGSAGGGGYDKQSHALAAAIERVAGIPVAHVGGAGVSAVAAAVAAAGWRLVDSDTVARRDAIRAGVRS